ncbi:VOC family protein [Planotetraspora sp. GP83]|uniref:VOC family protein n=1 Tax=Planotetraspora sp. GP83 TaxID=3156264 RepID=UPI0035116ED9
MTETTEYQPGVPCWVDLSTTDVTAATAFYGEVFGWEAGIDPRPEAGGYGQFRLRGKRVAGVGPTFVDGMPAVWNTYIATDDIERTAESVREAGGTVVMGPMQVFEEGWLGVFQDPAGAFFGAWRPGNHKGAELVNEPGTLTWNELATRDVEAAKAFYSRVFGWESQTHEGGPMPYTEFQVDGRSIAGMMPMGDLYPPEVPPHWLVYFGVADCDEAVDGIQRHGGRVLLPPKDIPIGRFAILADPQGASFAVWQATGR